jgi:endoglycosylceramidase
LGRPFIALFWAAALFALSLLLNAQVFASGLIRAEGPFFKDQQGRIIFLRGVNISNTGKVPPFNPLRDDRQLEWIQDFGMNNIRLLFIWEAFEPERGKYNFAYLERLGGLVEEASKRGIYTVVDFHADAFSRFILNGCGSGFPKWTLPKNLEPSTPINDLSCKNWGLDASVSYLFGSDVWEMSQAFFSNTEGVRTRYMLAWRQIARFFKKYPMVVGYDLLNEPWGDEITEVAPLYEDVAQVIRQEDPKAVLFVEPAIFSLTAVLTSELPRPSFGNFAYAAHSYDVTVLGTQSWYTGRMLIEKSHSLIAERMQEWGVPIYIGEYGVAANGTNLDGYIELNYALNDYHLFSGAQWDFNPEWTEEAKDGWNVEDMSIVDPHGNPRNNFKIRPYPKAIAGEPLSFRVDDNPNIRERYVQLDWYHRPSLGVTEISVPRRLFFGNRLVLAKISDSSVKCNYDRDGMVVRCQSDSPGVVSVRLSAGPREESNNKRKRIRLCLSQKRM